MTAKGIRKMPLESLSTDCAPQLAQVPCEPQAWLGFKAYHGALRKLQL